jgi:hypothetical protein
MSAGSTEQILWLVFDLRQKLNSKQFDDIWKEHGSYGREQKYLYLHGFDR